MTAYSEHNGYPTFSADEFARRSELLREIMKRTEASVVVVYGSGRAAADIQYLTNWIVQREGILLATLETEPILYVQYYNHVPTAQQMSIIRDVRWGGDDTGETIVRAVRESVDRPRRIGYVGNLSLKYYLQLRAAFPSAEILDLTSDFQKVRLVKSDEEFEWLAAAAAVTDAAIPAVLENFVSGMTDDDLVGLVHAAHAAAGGLTQVAFVASTAMESPVRCVPAQHPTSRSISRGDAILAEISGQFWGYSGQVLRTFTVGAPPTPLYSHLHSVAIEVFQSIAESLRAGATLDDVYTASSPIRNHGLTIYDDLIHGYGGGYLPPILRASDFESNRLPAFVFEPNMVVVIQPNVITLDGRAGVQVGEMVRITDVGVETMHKVPLEVLRLE
jgi:Xaa-Pro aminopeptidase